MIEDIFPSAEKHYLVIPYKHHDDYVKCDATVLAGAYNLAISFAEMDPLRRLRENYSIKFNYTTDEQTQRILSEPVQLPGKSLVSGSVNEMNAEDSIRLPVVHYYTEDCRQKIRHAHLHLMMGCARKWNYIEE